MNDRIKWSLLAGCALGLSLHTLSAVITALYPYRDYPMAPRLVFVYLLLPGWAIGGYPYPYRLWNAIIAVVVNSGIYISVVFCLLTIRKRVRRRAANEHGRDAGGGEPVSGGERKEKPCHK
jgi:hypothetical protein